MSCFKIIFRGFSKGIIVAIGLIWLAACESDTPEPGLKASLRDMTASEVELVNSSNDFAFNLLKVTDQTTDEENVFISPLSVGMALGMLYNGAEGTTKEEIEATLGFSGFNKTELNKTFNELMSLLLMIDDKVDLSVANSVWYKEDYTVKDEFRNLVMAYFDAEVQGLDFTKESAVSTINNWVDAKTLGKIPVLLEQIPPEAVMYLINAMHFKALWKQQFDAEQTQKASFHTGENEELVDMMHGKDMPMLHYRDSDLELVELSYGDGQFCLTVMMPAKDPESFLNNLTSESFNHYIEMADSSSMDINMPKFSLAFEITLNDVLKTMGLKRAFTDQAELGELFEETLPLTVSEVLHKAVIEVDESGTEAAAVTSVGIELTSIPMAVDLNRPFIFMIRERHTKAILFSGILRNPVQ